MTSDDDPSGTAAAKHALAAPGAGHPLGLRDGAPGAGHPPGLPDGAPGAGHPPGLPDGAPGAGHPPGLPGRSRALIARRTRLAASRRRPWWKWLLIGLLLAFSIATTWLYVAALIRDISLRHWGAAIDASRGAVPAAVGWAALVLLFFPRSTPEAGWLLTADNHALSEKLRQAARDQDSMDNAEQKVQRLTARLASLTESRGRAATPAGLAPPGRAAPADTGLTYLDPGAIYLGADDAELDREVAETTARLEQARQWLTSARDAVAASQRAVADAEERLMCDFPDLPRRPDRTLRKPA